MPDLPGATFHYRVPWPVQGFRQGDHRSASTGDTGAYRAERLLREASEARHLSLRASVRDPFSRWWVREYLHHTTLNIWILADISQSMRSPQSCATLAQLVRSTSLSSRKVGDRLGLVSAAGNIAEQLSTSACIDPARLLTMANQIGELANTNPGVQANSSLDSVAGLLRGALRTGRRRSLVMVASDFHADDAQWDKIFNALQRHLVVPIVIWHLPDLLMGNRRGLVNATDAETGTGRLLWMRGGLRRRLRGAIEQRFEHLEELFSRHQVQPVYLYDGFDAGKLTARFVGNSLNEDHPLDSLSK